MKFQIVDAFTHKIFGGNPAGVVMLPTGADFPEDEIMRKTAAELRYSETAFVKQKGENLFQTRYFTPAAEVDLCGHATIGSAYALMQEGLASPQTTITYETLAGVIAIELDENEILMEMASPVDLGGISEEEALEELYGIMGISPEGQGVCMGKPEVYLTPEMVSTGLADIMLPIKSEEELAAITPDFPALTELSRKYQVVGVHAFTLNGEDGGIHARNFAPLYDIDEEAATGTSNGALAYNLFRHGILKPEEVVTVIQGEAMNRPSGIAVKVQIEDDRPKIWVGGTAVTLAHGEINL